MTTLRAIITEDLEATWTDSAGEVWDGHNILDQWGEDLDREAQCISGHVRFIGADGYVTGAESVLVEVPSEDDGPDGPGTEAYDDLLTYQRYKAEND